MKIIVKHSKPGAYDLFYPNNKWTSDLLVMCNPKRPAKAFTYEQMVMAKNLGYEIEVSKSEQPVPIL